MDSLNNPLFSPEDALSMSLHREENEKLELQYKRMIKAKRKGIH